MLDRLFVYGTLQPGQSNASVLRRIGGTFQPATICGRLYPEGWGAASGFPALVLDEEGEKVPGYVFSSDGLSRQWQRLDAFEGDGYRRVVATVRLEDGKPVEAHVYVLNEKTLEEDR